MKFLLSDTKLELVLEGMEQVWALKRTISIPAEAVKNVEWIGSTANRWRLNGLRFPGTSIPGVFYAGSFYHRSGWVFRYIRARKPGCLMITTNMRRYHAIRVTIEEIEGLRVRTWFLQQRRAK